MATPSPFADPLAPTYTLPQAPPKKPKQKPRSATPSGPTAAQIAAQLAAGAPKPRQTKIGYKQLRSLWIAAGGPPQAASTMAAIALATSGGIVGPGLFGPEAAALKPPVFKDDPLATARAATNAALKLYRQNGALNAFSGYTTGAWTGEYTPTTPQEKAAAKGEQAKADLQQPGLIQTKAELSAIQAQARAQAVATAHFGDNAWVTVDHGKNGVVTFGEATGPTPPENVLTQGSVPLTKAMLNQMWTYSYNDTFEQFTGRVPTQTDMYDVITNGLTPYALKQKLAGFDPATGKFAPNPEFRNSPVYQANAQTVADIAKQYLGQAAPASFVAKAILYGWSAQDIQANVKLLPGYQNSPGFQRDEVQIKNTYRQIYGEPDQQGTDWIRTATLAGTTPDQAADALRAAPAYKYSLEAQTNTLSLLDTLGLLVGKHAVLKPTQVPNPPLPKGNLNVVAKSGVLNPPSGPSPSLPLAAGLGSA